MTADLMTRLIEADYARYQQLMLNIREQVFIIEQRVPAELELDGLDPDCRHALLFANEIAVATGRITPEGHIGRIAVLSPYRHQGYGRQIINQLEAIARSDNLQEVELSAQLYTIPFYEKLGYQAYGMKFLDAGIGHIRMKKTFTNIACKGPSSA